MNLEQQKEFATTLKDAKVMVSAFRKDYVIISLEALKSNFKIIPAETFFQKGLKYNRIICYLAHDGK